MAGDELRQLSAERRKTVDTLARRAIELGREQGYSAPEGAVQEVGQTLQSGLGDPEIADLIRDGHLTQAVTYGGFGPTDLASALGASLPTKAPSQPKEKAVSTEPAPADPKQRRQAEKAAKDARERATATRKAAESAKRRLKQPPSARMSWPTRLSRCAPSSGRPRPPSGRPARQREPPGSIIKSCAKPPLRPNRRQLLQTRRSLSEA